MIDDKKIEEAKEEIYEDRFLLNGDDVVFDNDAKEEMFYKEDIKEAIKLGAEWAINELLKDLWHPASEEPRQFAGLKDCEGKEIWEGDMLSNVTNDSPDGIVVFKYGAFCLLAKNGRDFCVALTYLMGEKESLNRFKVIGNKFDKKD